MLEVKNIHAAYGKVNVLRGIDLHLEEGEIVAVLGSNGAGKTTLNHNLCGLRESESCPFPQFFQDASR